MILFFIVFVNCGEALESSRVEARISDSFDFADLGQDIYTVDFATIFMDLLGTIGLRVYRIPEKYENNNNNYSNTIQRGLAYSLVEKNQSRHGADLVKHLTLLDRFARARAGERQGLLEKNVNPAW